MWVAVAILGTMAVGVLVGSLINPAVGIAFLILVLLTAPGVFLGREQMMRQRRIMQMKRFRREAQARQSDFTAQDKHTMV